MRLIVANLNLHMRFLKESMAIMCVAITTGCATTRTEVVNIGANKYMIGGQGSAFDHSGSVVKARFLNEARSFCAERGLAMELFDSTARDSGLYTYASAEVQFRCAPR